MLLTPARTVENMDTLTAENIAPKTMTPCSGVGRAYGSVVSLLAGVTSKNESFNLPLPLQAVSTVNVRLRPAKETVIRGAEGLKAISSVITDAFQEFDLPAAEVFVKHRTMIPHGVGAAETVADASAALRALYAALERPESHGEMNALVRANTLGLDPQTGFTGSDLSTMSLLDSESDKVLASFPLMPKMTYVLIRTIKKPALRQGLVSSKKYDALLQEALKAGDLSYLELCALASRSADLSMELGETHQLEDFLKQEFAGVFNSRGLKAPLGYAVSSTTHNAALLFEPTFEGHTAAVQSSIFLREFVGDSFTLSLSTTHSPRP